MTTSSKSLAPRPPGAPPTPEPAQARQPEWCLPLLFLLLGLVFAAWASRIPAVRDGLGLTTSQLGIALLCAGVGGIASFPLAAWMVARHGQVTAAFCGGVALLLSLPCIAFSPAFAALLLALGLHGAAASCFDVAINAIGAAAEKKAGRSIMSRLHAWFCVGTVTGALSSSLLASQNISPQLHFTALASLMIVPLWLAYRALAPAHRPSTLADGADPLQRARPRFGWPPQPLLVLGLLGFCGAITEGGIADWSGVFLQDRVGASAGVAPLGYAGFAGAMLLARLLADRLKDRFGARRVVAAGAVVATFGIGIAVTAAGATVTIAGFALAGAGLAGVFPFVFSAAGREGPTALAGVATISYSGALVGPPVIGFIGEFIGLQAALGSLGLLCAVMVIIASRARSLV